MQLLEAGSMHGRLGNPPSWGSPFPEGPGDQKSRRIIREAVEGDESLGDDGWGTFTGGGPDPRLVGAERLAREGGEEGLQEDR